MAGRISEIKGIGKLGSPLILLANNRRAVFLVALGPHGCGIIDLAVISKAREAVMQEVA